MRAYAFCQTRTCFTCREKGSGILRNTNYQGTLLYPFLLMMPSYICPSLNTDKDEKEEKGKVEQPYFFFQSFLTHQ